MSENDVKLAKKKRKPIENMALKTAELRLGLKSHHKVKAQLLH